jgi:hypothetical protein
MSTTMLVSLVLLCSSFVRPLAFGWPADQVNTSMCFWQNPRGMSSAAILKMEAHSCLAAIVRDAVYVDGGSLWWRPGLSDGTYGSYVSDGMRPSLLGDNVSYIQKETRSASSTFLTSAPPSIHRRILAAYSQQCRKPLEEVPRIISAQITRMGACLQMTMNG